MARPSRIRDVPKALGYFSDFLSSTRTYAWVRLADVDGAGSEKAPGGVGAAQFEAWIHRTPYRADTAARQVAQYVSTARHFGTDMLPSGPHVSRVQVCFPVDDFSSPGELLAWVVTAPLVSQAAFFSGSAGCKVLHYLGAETAESRAALTRFLHDYPGLDFDPSLGNWIGRLLNATQTDFVPLLKRVNWLSLVSDEGLAHLGGAEAARGALEAVPGVRVHQLAHGVCVQAGERPALARSEPGLQAYRGVSAALRALAYRPHPRDHFSMIDESAAKAWLTAFLLPESPPTSAGPGAPG